jgi:hypothetical protein
MSDVNRFQQKLATWVVAIGAGISGLCAIVAIGAIAVTGVGGQQTAQAAKDILTILLPVIGTWIGTVLAFYYSRENFEAASRETRLSLGQRLAKPAIDVAIPIQHIDSIDVSDVAAANALRLQMIEARLSQTGFYRGPIFTTAKLPIFVIHRQPLDSFVACEARASRPIDDLTVADLLNSPEGRRWQNAFVTVSERSTLADAKAAMESRKGCQDVFITRTGQETSSVVGWLTNNEIQREASA